MKGKGRGRPLTQIPRFAAEKDISSKLLYCCRKFACTSGHIQSYHRWVDRYKPLVGSEWTSGQNCNLFSCTEYIYCYTDWTN